MASFRCIALTPNLRFIVKSYSSGFTNNLPKLLDVGVCAAFPSTVNSQFISSRNLSTSPLLQSSLLHDSQGLFSPFSKQSVLDTLPVGVSHFSTSHKLVANEKGTDETKTQKVGEEKDDSTLTVFQRFKKTYREHGKILIGVHCVTSVVWFGSFYMAAVSGVDIVPLMEQLGLSETLIKPFRAGGLGFVALAYLMYKLATPARYTLTLGGTNMAIRYMRRSGKMEPIAEGEKIRNLYKAGKVEFKDRQLTFRERRSVIIRNRKLSRDKES
ncbi:uncharacterized protein C18orf19 homolog A-like [Haliotis rufescens]|uniref:uncharacterized protein C18orf19 homolog A-like n=1 Tax=Haliotis rufescens TaxID=6454 RepID=UPI00201EE84F|nr:uncharacterized protein C18orf19 homolog A-like [Haliotis rufescens]